VTLAGSLCAAAEIATSNTAAQADTSLVNFIFPPGFWI
jgi:hypothetical protein